MDATPTRPPTSREDLRTLHRRTWELELLISGAVVFGMVQLPPLVDRTFARMEPRFGEALAGPAFLAYYYVKLILLTLLLSFVLHLACRAFWVAMVGLDSVFPRGMQWSRSRAGPISKSFMRRRLPSVKRLAAAADSFSSVIFSVAWSMVGVFVGSSVAGALIVALAFGISRLVFGGEHMAVVTWTLIALAVLPSWVAATVDRVWGERLDRHGWPARLVRLGLASAYWLILQPLHAPVMMTLGTNLRARWVTAAMGLAAMLVITTFVVDVFRDREILRADASPFLPQVPGAVSYAPRYYDSTRGGSPLPAVPTIQSQVVDDRYLRLFLPYDASRDDADIRAVCPDAPALTRPGLRLLTSRSQPAPVADARTVLDCLARLWSVALDGAALADLELRFYEHPESRVPGVAAFLPTEPLAPGEHLLVIERRDVEAPSRTGDADEAAEPEDREPRRYYIPFMR